MTNIPSDKQRPHLVVPRDEAKQRIMAQIEKAKTIPNASINENDEARRWYDFTTELLRQFFTTDALSDEFTGRRSFFSGDDISANRYLRKLISIHERLDLYPERSSTVSRNALIDPVAVIERIIYRFHIVVRQIRQRYNNRPTLDVSDEYDIHDLFYALLKIYFDDIRPEEWTPSYSGGSSRMDFLLKEEKTVVELKKTRAKLGAKEVGEQLATDILRYRSHPDCRMLICFIYDPEERILNPSGLEHDLSQSLGELKIKVYVAQR
jgi:hypothetical protein